MDDISVRSFIIDPSHLDMLHLRIELWDHVVIGEDERIGTLLMNKKQMKVS